MIVVIQRREWTRTPRRPSTRTGYRNPAPWRLGPVPVQRTPRRYLTPRRTRSPPTSSTSSIRPSHRTPARLPRHRPQPYRRHPPRRDRRTRPCRRVPTSRYGRPTLRNGRPERLELVVVIVPLDGNVPPRLGRAVAAPRAHRRRRRPNRAPTSASTAVARVAASECGRRTLLMHHRQPTRGAWRCTEAS